MSRQSIPGMSDLGKFVPAKRLTVYLLASISKPITAVAIQTHLRHFRVKPWPITTRYFSNLADVIRTN